ncbi:Uncharacterized protein TCM_036116 [Theobroma cacao]|uniref:Uncharacterized protein n=1 Tax=Theobroma cacao TaxID=3641 RepID=A0A061FJA3_THECC|nr:Uncharacterized protein TCM_036116 [Theobroma cacao]
MQWQTMLILRANLSDSEKQGKLKVNSFESRNKLKMQQKHDLLDELLEAIERMNIYGFLDATNLCLVPYVIILPKFKVPDFEKYDGTKWPKTYITMYCPRWLHMHKMINS